LLGVDKFLCQSFYSERYSVVLTCNEILNTNYFFNYTVKSENIFYCFFFITDNYSDNKFILDSDFENKCEKTSNEKIKLNLYRVLKWKIKSGFYHLAIWAT
jgi:hypothetical protein